MTKRVGERLNLHCVKWLMRPVLLMSICLPAWANSGEAEPPITCLGEQLCAEVPRESTLRSRALANAVLEAVYALPEQEKRFFLDKRRAARGFAIFPKISKGGVMGASIQGRGIMVFKDEKGAWGAPILLSLQGQSIGPQFGTQSSNLIFIFKTLCGIKDFLSGHHHFQSNGSEVTIEHVGDTAPSEPMGISVHAFERGVMLGQSLDRYEIHIDEEANAALYGVAIKPGCIVEGVRIGIRRPWFQRYYDKLNLPPDVAHTTIEPMDLPYLKPDVAQPPQLPVKPDMPPRRDPLHK